MKPTFFLLLFSAFYFGQNVNLELQRKYEKYDSIDIFSKEFPTKLIEGSGLIKNKKKQKIGSIGFSTEITKNRNGKLILIKKEQSNHYLKKRKQIPKTEWTEITVYFSENQKPEFAKYTSELIIDNKLVRRKTNYYNFVENYDNYEFNQIKVLLNETAQ